MTLYEYTCPQHGKFEVRRTMSDTSTQRCPKCNSSTRRVISTPAVHYRGTGFYHIDSGKRFESQLSPEAKERYRKQRG